MNIRELIIGLLKSQSIAILFWISGLATWGHEISLWLLVLALIMTAIGLLGLICKFRNKVFVPIFENMVSEAAPQYEGDALMRIISDSQTDLQSIGIKFSRINFSREAKGIFWYPPEEALSKLDDITSHLYSYSFNPKVSMVEGIKEAELMKFRIQIAIKSQCRCAFVVKLGAMSNDYGPEQGFWI